MHYTLEYPKPPQPTLFLILLIVPLRCHSEAQTNVLAHLWEIVAVWAHKKWPFHWTSWLVPYKDNKDITDSICGSYFMDFCHSFIMYTPSCGDLSVPLFANGMFKGQNVINFVGQFLWSLCWLLWPKWYKASIVYMEQYDTIRYDFESIKP